jgi:hypothetical protein
MLHTDANKDIARCAGVGVFADETPPIVFRKYLKSGLAGWDHTILYRKGRAILRLSVHRAQGGARHAESKLYTLSSSLYGSSVSAQMLGLPTNTGVRDHIRDQRWRSAGELMEYMHEIKPLVVVHTSALVPDLPYAQQRTP